MKGFLYPSVTDNAKVITDVTVDSHLMGAVGDQSEYIVMEDSSAYSSNYLVLDKHETDVATRIRVLNESSNAAVAAGSTISRVNVVPEDTTALTDDTFGFTETFEFFPHGETYDPVAGTDS
jgi:hypothetical protein